MIDHLVAGNEPPPIGEINHLKSGPDLVLSLF